MKKFIKRVIVFGILIGIGYGTYQYFFVQTDNIQSIYLVPENAVFIIETKEPFKNWQKISHSALWKHLRNNSYFSELTESINSLDSTIQRNKILFKLVGSRNLVISAHMYKNTDYDFLYIIDLQKAARLGIDKLISNIAGASYKVTRRDYQQHKIIELYDTEDNETLYIVFINNQMVASYTHSLVEASIDQHSQPVIGRDINYLEINKRIAGDDLFRIYLNYSYLDDYLKCYMDEENGYAKDLSRSLYYTGVSFDMDEDCLIKMKGYTNINADVESYPLALLNSGRGNLDIVKVTPARTGFYMGLGFTSFLEFYNNFENILSKDSEKYTAYQENIEKVEKLLKINIKDNFIR